MDRDGLHEFFLTSCIKCPAELRSCLAVPE